MIEDAVSQLRGRLFGTAAGDAKHEPPEARLEHACVRGRGHVVVTGGNRAEIDLLLRRVLARAAPIATIRTTAGAAESSVDEMLSKLLGQSDDDSDQGFVQRRARLLELLAKAQEADKSIFFVVDTADDVALEKLEKFCRFLDVAPEAAKRLRVVLVGDAALRDQLAQHQGRQLSARIGAYVRVGEPMPVDATPAPTTIGLQPEDVMPRGGRGWTLATATAVAFSLAVYAAAFRLGNDESGNVVGGDVRKAIAEAMQVAMPSRFTPMERTSLRGNEPFLRTSLAILTPAATPQSFAVAPSKPAPRIANKRPATPPPAAPAQRRTTTAATQVEAAAPAAKPLPKPTTASPARIPAKAAPPAGQADTSIDSFMQKFR
jgi:hypothetical protein